LRIFELIGGTRNSTVKKELPTAASIISSQTSPLENTIHIIWHYLNSLGLGHVPQAWKIAKIVTICQPGKANYTALKAFRPIPSLQTISKDLEAAVAA
jgi:hypothetical protein